ncbi:MAG: SMI1/KNR4 family protein [Planctomycetaceae bacterium]|nr:SMI1/KNR4 family protein [Planctomycetaceae bacterium]
MQDLLTHMSVQLTKLASINFGYPIGENRIRAALPDSTQRLQQDSIPICVSRWLGEFYSQCDGFSLPDVHVGYFVDSLDRVTSHDSTSRPESVLLQNGETPVRAFGSTGGGGLFVVECGTGSVLFLPPGPLRNAQYDGRSTAVKVVAPEFSEFIRLIVSDVTAFVRSDRKHQYVANR